VSGDTAGSAARWLEAQETVPGDPLAVVVRRPPGLEDFVATPVESAEAAQARRIAAIVDKAIADIEARGGEGNRTWPTAVRGGAADPKGGGTWATWAPGFYKEADFDKAAPFDRQRFEEAIAQVDLDRQQGLFLTNGKLPSMVVYGQHLADDGSQGECRGAPAEDAMVIGMRWARARFPNMTDKQVFVFANDPRNLRAANAMRNKGVGIDTRTKSERTAHKLVTEALKKYLYCEANIQEALKEYESWSDSLPKKLSKEEREKIMQDAMHIDPMKEHYTFERPTFDLVVDAFVKAECVAKAKPRPIANHKEKRLAAVGKIAWIYDWITAHKLPEMTAKGEMKEIKMSKIFRNMSKQKKGVFVENDLTAFEFGVHSSLKRAESSIFSHIAAACGCEEVGFLFERVIHDRGLACTWSMMYKDETGERRKMQITMPRAMRESGDRWTSSGNFLQNLIAWLAFLLGDNRARVDEAVKMLVANGGKFLRYQSPRDKKWYMARLAFEGDDTVGRLEEGLVVGFSDECEAYFRRLGWSPKLLWKKQEGYDYVRFIGYDALLHDNKIVEEGDAVVMLPEVKRFITTKQWTTSNVAEEDLKLCNRVFAAVMGTGFRHLEPLWYLCRNIFQANAGSKVTLRDDSVLREQYMLMTGELPGRGEAIEELGKIKFPPFEGGGPFWRILAEVTAGECSDFEWASMCTDMDLRAHGADLAAHFARSWLA